MFEVSIRRFGAFSQMHPPCMFGDTMHTGAAAATRSSTAVSRKVWVPPPDAPVQPMRSPSTSGRLCRKSRERMLFHNCTPGALIPQSASSGGSPETWHRPARAGRGRHAPPGSCPGIPPCRTRRRRTPARAKVAHRAGTEQASESSSLPCVQCPCGQSTAGRDGPSSSGRYRLPVTKNPGRLSKYTFSVAYPSCSTLPNTRAFSGCLSGMGHRPQQQRIRWRRSCALRSHSSRSVQGESS